MRLLGARAAAPRSAPSAARARRRLLLPLAVAVGDSLLPVLLHAQEHETGGHGVGATILWIAVLLLAAKIAGSVERLGQPAVLGELLIGVILGILTLVGLGLFEAVTADPILAFLAELGVIVLLFQIGLESNLGHMRRVGARAFAVAIVGVVTPFVLGT